MADGKITPIIAGAGWVVALASLVINFLTFQDNRAQRSKALADQPTYESTLRSYDPSILPTNILAIKDPIPHEFFIVHKSGQAIKNLAIEFISRDAPILDVKIIDGQSGTDVKTNVNAREVRVTKPELLRASTVHGLVFTQGITKLNMTVDADQAVDSTALQNRLLKTRSFFASDTFFFLFLGLVVVFLSVSAYLAMPPSSTALRTQSGQRFLDTGLLVSLVILAILPMDLVSPERIFYAVLLFVLVTRGRTLLSTLDRFCPPSEQGSSLPPGAAVATPPRQSPQDAVGKLP
jgi:hypothetical protein